MEKLCPYGKEEKIDSGYYFMCSLVGRHCAFVRRCTKDDCFKMLDSYMTCKAKTQQDKS